MSGIDDPSRPRLRRAWAVAFAAFFLLGAGWAVGLPVNGTYDEKQHIVRAYAVADGQLLPIATAIEESFVAPEGFAVPGTLLPHDPHCLWYPTEQAASCQGPPGPPQRVSRVSGVARYSPVYYLPVGIPMVLLILLDAWSVRSIGWFSHARYVLPAAVGIILVAALADRFTGPSRTVVTRPTLLVALTVPLHVYALAMVISTYRSGPTTPINPFRGDWTPIWGPSCPWPRS